MSKHPTRAGSLPIGLLSGAALATALGWAAHVPAQSQYMDVDDVKPGMKGYGLTVFSGTKPERFDIEVVSTLHNFRPGQDLVIIKTPHPRLDIARTVAGMSGSPIYIDNKLIGAYAYGWFFNVEPIAGVTPIENMLDDLKRPVPKTLIPGMGAAPLPGGSAAKGASSGAKAARRAEGVGEHRFAGTPVGYDLRDHAGQVSRHVGPKLAAPTGAGLRPATTDVMVGGLGPKAMHLVSELLEPAGLQPMQAGGGGAKAKTLAADAPDKFVDGGVVNVELVRGDISMSVGTANSRTDADHHVGGSIVMQAGDMARPAPAPGTPPFPVTQSGGDVSIRSGLSTQTSSGDIILRTANSGAQPGPCALSAIGQPVAIDPVGLLPHNPRQLGLRHGGQSPEGQGGRRPRRAHRGVDDRL